MKAVVTKGKVNFTEVNTKGEEKPAAHYGYLKGIAKWAQVLKEDDYGNFSICIYPNEEDLAAHKELFDGIVEQAKEAAEDIGKQVSTLAPVLKTDNDGVSFIQFKLKATDFEGNATSIQMVDAGGNSVPSWDKLVGNGSLVKIKYRAAPYYMSASKTVGLSYRFYAVQVIKLVEYSGGSSSGFGDETDSAPFETSKDF